MTILLLSINGCRKEGLSKSTGNIEISIPSNERSSLTLYTELQFDNFLNFRPSTFYKESPDDTYIKNGREICVFRGIPAGNYGYHLYWWVDNNVRVIKKSIVVLNKKTVKESFD